MASLQMGIIQQQGAPRGQNKGIMGRQFVYLERAGRPSLHTLAKTEIIYQKKVKAKLAMDFT